jgi:pyruvate dehydrogenase E2 component (dihydrolipoamide acetyltransferase)
VRVPHVTQFDQADITELESFRKSLSAEYGEKGIKVTILSFLIKSLVSALKEFPHFNSSLDPTQENLILKHYYHIGVAVDTTQGLVVPIVREADRKSLVEVAAELMQLSARAREGKLSPGDMQGGCFSISSLGGLGGTAFTPIINAPEVAILGVSRASMQPVYQDAALVPRLILPLSLSYDHRVIDGADGARFTTFLSSLLSDTRRMLL